MASQFGFETRAEKNAREVEQRATKMKLESAKTAGLLATLDQLDPVVRAVVADLASATGYRCSVGKAVFEYGSVKWPIYIGKSFFSFSCCVKVSAQPRSDGQSGFSGGCYWDTYPAPVDLNESLMKGQLSNALRAAAKLRGITFDAF